MDSNANFLYSTTPTHFSSSDLSAFVAAPSLQPMIDVMDRGTPPRDEICAFVIMLYSTSDTVTAIVNANSGTLNNNVFESILGGILELDIDVTSKVTNNGTFFTVNFTGRDGQELVMADDLLARVESLLTNEQDVALLRQAGLAIVEVTSNAPVSTTPSLPTPTRPIPPWAVAVIVVLNSVIIIAVLLIVLGITWRRYRR